jgi:hypothetical protein
MRIMRQRHLYLGRHLGRRAGKDDRAALEMRLDSGRYRLVRDQHLFDLRSARHRHLRRDCRRLRRQRDRQLCGWIDANIECTAIRAQRLWSNGGVNSIARLDDGTVHDECPDRRTAVGREDAVCRAGTVWRRKRGLRRERGRSAGAQQQGPLPDARYDLIFDCQTNHDAPFAPQESRLVPNRRLDDAPKTANG